MQDPTVVRTILAHLARSGTPEPPGPAPPRPPLPPSRSPLFYQLAVSAPVLVGVAFLFG